MTGIVVTRNLVINSSAIDDLNDDSPIIGYQNLVTTSNVDATTEETTFPASNLANPITHELWKASAVGVGQDYVTVTFDTVEDVDYLAIAAHNFGSGVMAVSVEGMATTVDSFTKLLLHFEGADNSTTFTDSSPSAHSFTANGDAKIDTAKQKFGSSSGVFDGTGDYINTTDSADFAFGSSDFTVDFWFNCAVTGGNFGRLAGQGGGGGFETNTSFRILKTLTNKIDCTVYVSSTPFTVTSTSSFTDVTNSGWHHLALVRSVSSLMLFIDGVLEATTAIAGAINNSTRDLTIGTYADTGAGSSPWIGWIDEFRLSNGIARWTTDFSASLPVEYPWTELTSPRNLGSDGPVIFRFTKQLLNAVRLRIQTSQAETPLVAQAGVMYVGELLYMQRRLYVGHTPFPMARRLQTANLLSVSGAFVGRIVLGQTRVNTAAFQNLTPDWYRANMDPFLIAAQEAPFFFAWRPGTYPDEAGFAWLTGDPLPDNQRANGMMQVTLEMEGVA